MQVGEMAGVCQRKAVVVAETKASCETLLVQIVADKRVADDQEKQVDLTWQFRAWPSLVLWRRTPVPLLRWSCEA